MKHAMEYIMKCVAILPMALAVPCGAACPDGVPAGLTAVAVGQNMVVDGMPLAVLQVRGRAAAAAVLAQVESAWRAAGHDVRRTEAAGWRIVAARSDGCLSTLQLTDRGGAFGYLAGSRSAATVRPGRAQLPVPAGATVLTTVSSSDDGRRGTIAALTSPRTLEGLHGDVLRRLHAGRWEAVGSQVSLDRSRAPVGALVSARRGRERIDVVIWRDGATHAVINVADAL